MTGCPFPCKYNTSNSGPGVEAILAYTLNKIHPGRIEKDSLVNKGLSAPRSVVIAPLLLHLDSLDRLPLGKCYIYTGRDNACVGMNTLEPDEKAIVLKEVE
jgi:hypothetical protein